MRRVVSLVPSSTETLLAIGANVVACTRFCEQPELLHVGGTKNPDVDAITELRPDIVVLDREENRREDAEALRQHNIDLFVSDVTTVAAAIDVVTDLAASADVTIPDALRTVLDASLPPARSERLRVFVPIWRRPWMTIGAATYGGSVLAHLGCRLVTTDPDSAYPEIDLADLAVLDPDVVLVPSEPYAFTEAHLDELAAAAPEATVQRIDGQDLFWWGSRTPQAIRRLDGVISAIDGRPPRA